MRRGRGRRAPVRHDPVGHFSRGPMDPPPAFKSGWQAVRIGVAIGSTSVTIGLQAVQNALTALNIAANAIKILKVAAWVTPGTAANGNIPRVIMSVRDPVSGGTLGTREDTGQLSRAAHVHYSYSQAVREHSLDLPGGGSDTLLLAVEASQAQGDIQISLIYNI